MKPARALANGMRRLRILFAPTAWVLGWMVAVLLVLGGALNWLLRDERGTAWLLDHLPRVHAEGLQGALLSDRWQLHHLRVDIGGALKAVVIEDLDAQGVVWRWDTASPRWLSLQVARVAAREVRFETGPGSGGAARLPGSIELPLAIDVGHLAVSSVVVGQLPPFTGVQAKASLDVLDGGHRVDELQFEWDRLRARASGHIQSRRPFALDVRALLRPAVGDDWSAELQSGGTLAALKLQAALRALRLGSAAAASHELPALDASAEVHPFDRWPLHSLTAQMQALDLADLASALPRTRLSGHAELHTSALNAPFTAELHGDNALAGRWDEGRLPLRHVELSLTASLQHRDQLEIGAFDLRFADAQGGDAGHWSGRGHWAGARLQLETALHELKPQVLDRRAPAWVASGPLTLTCNGITIPGSAPASPATATAPGAPAAPTPATLEIEVKSTLEGRILGTGQPLQLAVDAAVSAKQLALRQLRASSGHAIAQAQAMLQRREDGWSMASNGTLTDFDPRLWLAGIDSPAWRQATQRLTGDWRLDLTAPPLPERGGWMPWLQRFAGNGTMRLRDSQLAGVPLSLDVSLAQASTAAGAAPGATAGATPGALAGATPAKASVAAPATLKAELNLGGNRLVVEGQGQPSASGADDRWSAELSAPALAALAPLARLTEDLAPWAPREGKATFSVQGTGRWPELRSSGKLALDQVRLGELALQQAQALWRFDTARNQPLDLQLELHGLHQGRQGIEHAHLALQGTLQQHRLQLDASLPLRPPPWLEDVLGTRVAASTGTQARLSAEGQWAGDGSGGGDWRGRIASLQARDWDPQRNAIAPGSSWLQAEDLRATLHFSAEEGLTELRAEPAKLRLADAITLRWDAVRVDMRPATPDFALRAEIESFAAAPVLARLQPTMGWGGDLQLAATLDLKASSNFDADVVFERRSGDLFIEDAIGRQPLGLTALRVALDAHNGRWRFTPRMTGRSLGDIQGMVQASTRSDLRWPDAKAPLEGQIVAQVNDIGIWSAWVPPGWRLVGRVNTRAGIGGSFGAPQYTGALTGSGIGVRNLLQGVDVAGGEVKVVLEGDHAQIEHFSLKGGDGSLTLSGGAEFGASPVAHVKLEAERFRVLGRIDRMLLASGNATLELRSDRLKLDGQVHVDEGLFDVSRRDAPSLDEDVNVRGATGPASGESTASDGAAAADAARPTRRVSQVALQVDLGDKLRVRGRGLDTLLAGQLRLSTPEGRPQLNGIVRAVGGTYVGYGQKLEIDRGLLIFNGPPENPNLDIRALRPNLDVRVGVAIVGTLVNPRVRLYSDPDMSETDKLSWLVLGRPSDGLGRADTALLQRAAVALLAGEGEAPTDTFLHRIGLDDLSVRQGDTDVRETVVSLGKQLSRRWYLGYERSVNATSGSWQLIYRIAQRFTLRAQTGHENSLDVIWVWRRGEASAQPAKP